MASLFFSLVDFIFGTVVLATNTTNGGVATERVGTKGFIEAQTDDGDGSLRTTEVDGGDESVIVERLMIGGGATTLL